MQIITETQRQQYQQDGYFIARNLVEPSALAKIRVASLDFIDNPGDLEQVLDPELVVRQGKGEHLKHRAKFRKLQRLGRYRPTVWNNYYAHPNVLSIVRSLLRDDLLIKYALVFLKPTKTGGATPWHQDIGLWRDNHVKAANAWVAVDLASKENGCMQFLPGATGMALLIMSGIMIVCMVSCRVTWWPTWKGWSTLNYNLVMLSFGIPTCGTIVHPIAVIKAESVWVSLEQTQTSQRV